MAAPTPAADQVQRQFVARGPQPPVDGGDHGWAVPTAVGFLYLAVVLAVDSRRSVGWAMATHLRTALVPAALEMTVQTRRPARGRIQPSDQGCQYSQDTSVVCGRRCQEASSVPSTGSVGDGDDNAITAFYVATLDCACLASS